jgi:hypothetical protein
MFIPFPSNLLFGLPVAVLFSTSVVDGTVHKLPSPDRFPRYVRIATDGYRMWYSSHGNLFTLATQYSLQASSHLALHASYFQHHRPVFVPSLLCSSYETEQQQRSNL